MAAESLFADDGFHATSMDRITQAAGMSSSTVYSYFPGGKRELVHAVCDKRIDVMSKRVNAFLMAESPPSISQAFAEIFRGFEEESFLEVTSMDGRSPRMGERDGKPGGESDFGTTRLARLAVASWSEIVRDPELRERAIGRYAEMRESLVLLVERWKRAGRLETDLGAREMVVLMMNLYQGLLVEHVVTGNMDFATAAIALERAIGPRR